MVRSRSVASLYHRDRTPEGKGQYIDLALLDAMVATLSHRGMQYLISGKTSPRRGNVGGGGSPSPAFRCSDGQIVLTVGNDLQSVPSVGPSARAGSRGRSPLHEGHE